MARFNPFEGLPPKSRENTTGNVCIWGKKSIPSQNANVDLENHLSIIIYITIMGVGAQRAQGVQRCSEMFRDVQSHLTRCFKNHHVKADDDWRCLLISTWSESHSEMGEGEDGRGEKYVWMCFVSRTATKRRLTDITCCHKRLHNLFLFCRDCPRFDWDSMAMKRLSEAICWYRMMHWLFQVAGFAQKSAISPRRKLFSDQIGYSISFGFSQNWRLMFFHATFDFSDSWDKPNQHQPTTGHGAFGPRSPCVSAASVAPVASAWAWLETCDPDSSEPQWTTKDAAVNLSKKNLEKTHRVLNNLTHWDRTTWRFPPLLFVHLFPGPWWPEIRAPPWSMARPT